MFIAALFIRGQITFNVLFSLPLDICPEVGLMDDLVVDSLLFFRNLHKVFHTEPIYIYISLVSLHLCQHLFF